MLLFHLRQVNFCFIYYTSPLLQLLFHLRQVNFCQTQPLLLCSLHILLTLVACIVPNLNVGSITVNLFILFGFSGFLGNVLLWSCFPFLPKRKTTTSLSNEERHLPQELLSKSECLL